MEEFIYLVFTRMPGEITVGRFGFLLRSRHMPLER